MYSQRVFRSILTLLETLQNSIKLIWAQFFPITLTKSQWTKTCRNKSMYWFLYDGDFGV